MSKPLTTSGPLRWTLAINAANMGASEKLVAHTALQWIDWETGRTSVAFSTVGKAAGVQRRTVRAAVATMRKLGAAQMIRSTRGGRSGARGATHQWALVYSGLVALAYPCDEPPDFDQVGDTRPVELDQVGAGRTPTGRSTSNKGAHNAHEQIGKQMVEQREPPPVGGWDLDAVKEALGGQS